MLSMTATERAKYRIRVAQLHLRAAVKELEAAGAALSRLRGAKVLLTGVLTMQVRVHDIHDRLGRVPMSIRSHFSEVDEVPPRSRK